MKEVLEYSTKRLIENLNFFKELSYGSTIKASFFDNKEEFFKRIYELDNHANPPEWAKGCFYGNENQILIDKDNIKANFFTLAHETCHLLFQKFIYNNYTDRVVWLDESFAANFSGEVEHDILNGTFKEKVQRYLKTDSMPNLNDISFKKNSIKTKEYNAYDFFRIVGRYLAENYSNEDLLKLYKDEKRVLELGKNILRESLFYFQESLDKERKL